MPLTTKTLEHFILAYNLRRGRAVNRGKVAEAPQKTAQAEAPHAALAVQADRIRTAMRLRAGIRNVGGCRRRAESGCVYFEDEPGRRSAAKLLTKDEARRIAVNIAGAIAEAVALHQ